MYLAFSEIKEIQLDHTSRCNLKCEQCARTYHAGHYPIADLTVDDYKIILEPFEYNKDISIFHCGNYGDVIASPTFDETLDYCLSRGFEKIKISTNGSARNVDWWKNLAQKLGKKGTVTFAIDGFEDTNHIYRKNSNWKKIKENLEAFVNSGGRARWYYIIFDHNISEIETAKKYAQDIGVEQFSIKNSSRFITESGLNIEDLKILPEPKNKSLTSHEMIKKEYDSFENYLQKTNISCKYKKSGTIFIDFETRLWPCCWAGMPVHSSYENIQSNQMKHLFQKYGKDFNKLNIYGWDLLNHDFFSRYLERSWDKDFSDQDTPRLYFCGRTCGEKYEYSSGYGKNITTIKFYEQNKTT